MNASGRTNEELAVIAQQGDKAAMDELVRGNEGLVRSVVRRCTSPVFRALSHSDMMASGNIGLWQAACRFNPAVGVKFTTFAWRAIVWHIMRDASNEGHLAMPHRVKRVSGGERRQLSVVDPEGNIFTSKEPEPVDALSEVEDIEVEQDKATFALEDLEFRDPRAAAVINMRLNGLKFREIAEAIGTNHQRAHQIFTEARRKLRKAA